MSKNAREDNTQEQLREDLCRLMPLDSIVADLWDWDIQFQEESFDIVEAAFSDEDQVVEYAAHLANDFLQWIEKYDMDYNQHGWEPGEFERDRERMPAIHAAMAAERENQIQSLSIAEPDCRGDHFAGVGKMIL